ncbi:MAG TPA: hypothetical protein DCZ05_01575 [Deltaproteobacteria bacterium]|nr:hypothetical protein [Deltaproteobacteria bacterium]
MGECPPLDADRLSRQLRGLHPALFLSALSAFPRGRDGRRGQNAQALWRCLVSAWGFVFLAYGIVWFALLIYLGNLKRRFRKVERELSSLRSSGGLKKNA